jgi:hypothetical protein
LLSTAGLSYSIALCPHGSRRRDTEKEWKKRHELATMTNADVQYSVILAPFNIGGGQRKISLNKRFVQIAIQKSHG